MNENTVRMSIIIATRDRAEYVTNLLRDIASTQNASTEVILVNDGNNAEVEKIAAMEWPFTLKYESSVTRLNSCGARNRALSRVSGERILFLDDDVRLPADFFEVCDKLSEQYDCFSVRIQNQHQKRKTFLRNVFEHLFLGRIILPAGYFVGGFEREQAAARQVSHLPGAMMLFSRTAIGETRFDERIGQDNGYLDDADFSFSIKRKGFTLVYAPETHVIHLQAGSGGNRENDMQKWILFYQSHKFYFFAKHFSSAWFPLLFCAGFLEALARSIVFRKNFMKVFSQSYAYAQRV